jgi:hypothetical protein
MIITERDIPPYYQEIKAYLSREFKKIDANIMLKETGWGFKVDKSSYPAVRFEIETDVAAGKATLVNGTRVDGPEPRRVRRLPDKTYDLTKGIQPMCEYILEQLREASSVHHL